MPTPRPEPASAASTRLDWVDVVRGLALVLVVFYHSVIALDVVGADTPRWLAAVNEGPLPFEIPTLMFLSGLLLSMSLGKPWRVYVETKLRQIGWPWLVWTAITVAVLTAGSNVAGNGGFDLHRVLSFVVDPTTYTWYLAYLLVFYPLALVVPTRARLPLVPLLLVGSWLLDDGDAWSRFTFLFAIFLLGDAAMRHRASAPLVQTWYVRAAGAVLAATLLGWSAAGHATRFQALSVFGVLGAIVVLAPVAERFRDTAPGRALAGVGRDSIVYYTTHWVVIALLAHVLAAAGVRQATLATALMVVAGLAVSAVMVALRRRHAVVAGLYAFPRSRSSSPQPVSQRRSPRRRSLQSRSPQSRSPQSR